MLEIFKKKKSRKNQYECTYRYVTELIGFEGELKQACCHKGHPMLQNYAECCKEKCPEGKL